MLNCITIMGRLTRDPELRRTGSGIAVASFTVAVDRDFAQDGKKETDFIDCVAWRQAGEFVSKYFRKGSMIVVKGRLQIRSWNDKDGNKRKTAEVVADNCYFGDSKSSSDRTGGTDTGNAYGGEQYPETMAEIERQRNNNIYGGYVGGYSAPQYPQQNDYALLEGEDGQLPF